MVVFLLSLGGIPPTAGFIGKYYLFAAAMKAGYGWLAIIAVLMSAVSIFYYFRGRPDVPQRRRGGGDGRNGAAATDRGLLPGGYARAGPCP